MKTIKLLTILIIALVSSVNSLHAQRVAVASNGVEWLMLSPNLQCEISVAPKRSMTLDLTHNPINKGIESYSFNITTLRYGYRWWFTQPMSAAFIGVQAMATKYDIALFNNYYTSGRRVGIGFTYGYSIVLSSRWNLVPNIGYGVALTKEGYGAASKAKIKPSFTDIGVRMQYVIK
ncbi:MAG: DUF3575 domain-containing protein [Rikenellaceae bacterium]